MQRVSTYFNDRYNRLEIAFFISYFILFPIITGIEIYLSEKYSPGVLNNIPEQLIYGVLGIIPAWVFYKFVIQKYPFERKYLEFFALLLLYLILLNFYKSANYWVLSKLIFLPDDMATKAARYFHAPIMLHFSIIYMFREILVLSALAYFIRSAKQERQMNELKKQQLQAELKYLKVQLQPHFFFNTLNNIYALTLQQSDRAAPLVARHSEMMRYILYNSPNQTVSLSEETAFLKNYVEVEAIRYHENINITFETQGVNNKVIIEPLLLLPFIENTFKHGIREEVSSGYVHIVICLVENELTLETRNSKAARADDSRKGIGLENAEKRLDILYPGNHTLEIADNEADYEVRLTLKLKYNG